MKSRGFTLIEILVSLAIFSVVAVIAIGALVRVTSANRQAQNIQSGVNNVSFILDTISREMRTGTTYDCLTASDLSSSLVPLPISYHVCPVNTNRSYSPDTIIAFNSSNVDSTKTCNLVYAYLFHVSGATTTIYKAQQTKCADPIGGINNTTTGFFPILSSDVNITDYSVSVSNGLAQKFPWVFVRLKGYVGEREEDKSVFDVQTLVSQRISAI